MQVLTKLQKSSSKAEGDINIRKSNIKMLYAFTIQRTKEYNLPLHDTEKAEKF